MGPERHLKLLRVEGDRLASMPADALGAPVPTVDDWTLEAVVRHTGKVHNWVVEILRSGPGVDLGEAAGRAASLPKGPDCLPAYRDAVDAVTAELAGRDPNEPAASFVGPTTVGFWHRRQAQEVAVHRIDAADAVHAAGGPAPEPLDVGLAADGIDEWARTWLGVRWAQRYGTLPAELVGRTLHVHGTDDPAPADGAEWLLTLTADGVDVEATHAKGDVALRGPAQDLLLALWRRRPLDSLDVIGDAALAAHLLDVARF